MKLTRIQVLKNAVTIFCSSMLLHGTCIAQQKKYYVAASGNDNNNGLSPQTAWRSLDRANAIDCKPGDSILLESGSVFKGTLHLTSYDNGSTEQPVVITSYGKEKAIIDAGDSNGVLAANTSNLIISSVIVKGNGVDQNKGSGIHFFSNDTMHAPQNIIINDCDVSGFYTYGIAIGCAEQANVKGYEKVRITGCNASENGQGGIASYGSQLTFQHHNFYVGHCKVFLNRGIITKTENHSGNGIVIGEVDGLLVEYCEAYENGADNRCTAGGPVGIWV
jgi:hypothetical protein